MATTFLGPSPRRVHDRLERDLRESVDGEVRFDAGSCAAYSTDASNYRQVPIGVVAPRTPDAAQAAVAVCHRHDVPVLSRGGGTSLAGECCNTAVVLDWSKYCNRLVSLDAASGIAVVEPGIALDPLNNLLAESGWMVGPKPSTHVSCTIGGMIGNNSCGSTAQAYGKMADSVLELEVLTYDGLRMWVGPTSDGEFGRVVSAGGRRAEVYLGLRRILDQYESDIRARYPDIPRRVSGFNLNALLAENGFDVGRLLVGSESTLVTVLHAKIALFRRPRVKTLALLGFDDITTAADAVPAILEHNPAALEGFDHRLATLEHSQHVAEHALAELPQGNSWLMVQFNGDDQTAATTKAQDMVASLRSATTDATVVTDENQQKQVWAAREGGLGATAHPPGERDTHPGWEDAAVPPARLGDYLRDFHSLLDRYGYHGASLYGHFGHGCVHTRIPFDLKTATGVGTYRQFVTAAAHLVTEYSGSLSGEHGDGQARGELLPIMFGDRVVSAFGELKNLFDPADRMNPGKVVYPNRLDENLRWGTDYRPAEPVTHFSYPDDDHRFSVAANRCVGIGKCRGHESGVMCPSYRVTGEEEHSTRGRARLLFEMLEGDVVTDGWRSTEVKDALDLCLACKGCRSDCPVNVDMATYKAEFLSHHYAHRLRPLAHYSMGWLPALARIAALAPRPINTLAHLPGVGALLKAIGGIDEHRDIPAFAPRRFTRLFARRQPPSTSSTTKRVLLWPDTFTNNFDTDIACDAVQVLEAAGFEVEVPRQAVCCGLTWISTGQLATAERIARRTLRILAPALRDGVPVVVLEPSCAAVFRSDLPELLHGDEEARRLAALTRTLGEILSEDTDGWHPPALHASAIVQPHCHQHAIMGMAKDADVLTATGLDTTILDAGCCGLAGNFGFESGHYDISVACAEDKLMPAIRAAEDTTLVLADGFSCRTQIRHLPDGRDPLHTAQLLAAGLRGEVPKASKAPPAPRRHRPTAAVTATAASAAVALAVTALRRHRG